MRTTALVIASLGLTACGGEIGMDRQAKYLPQSRARLFANGSEAQRAPEGTVAVGGPQAEAAALAPPPVTLALVQRGRARHAIACTPCHGDLGRGDGPVVQRGFPHPLPYDDPHMKALSAQQIYNAITNGYGVMYAQAERVEPQDRWAIVAYMRALQIADRPRAPPPSGVAP